MCMVPCWTGVPSRMHSCLAKSVSGIDSESTATLSGIKQLLKMMVIMIFCAF